MTEAEGKVPISDAVDDSIMHPNRNTKEASWEREVTSFPTPRASAEKQGGRAQRETGPYLEIT